MSNYIIYDWAGNDVFQGKTFKSFDDANDFLINHIEKSNPLFAIDDEKFFEAIGEFYIDEKKGW